MDIVVDFVNHQILLIILPQQCFPFLFLETISAGYIQNTACCILDSNYMALPDDTLGTHIYQNQESKWSASLVKEFANLKW